MHQMITPPHSKEVEKDVLSVMVNRPELIVRVEEILHSDCFYDGHYRFLFESIFKLHMEGADITQSSLLRTVVESGKKDLLGTYQEMKQYFTSDTFLWRNAMLLSDLSVKRAMLRKSMEIQAAISQNATIDKLDQLVNESSELMTSRNRPLTNITFSHSLDELETLIDRPETKLSGITTGVDELDELTGGWQVDDMGIIAGRPGMGKTMVGVFHAYHAALAGHPVAFISLEMSTVKLTSRIMSNVCGVSASDMTKGRLAMNQKMLVKDSRKKVDSLPIYYYDNKNSWDIADICLQMRNWRRKHGIELIFIDYVQLIKDRTVKDSSDSTKVITSVSQKLTHLKGTLGVPIIELAQLSRNNEGRADKRPGLSDLKGSGQLEQDASIVIFLYRQDYYDSIAAMEKKENFVPSNNLEYIFAKNRAGETGSTLLKCDMRLNRIWSPDESFFPPKASSFKLF